MNSSTAINPFTVDLHHSLRPKCECESCTRTRILAMKDGHILIAHMDEIDRLTHAAFKQKQATDRRLRVIDEIVAKAGVLRISSS